MNISDAAVSYHAEGNNCAQSVLKACSEYTGFDPDLAYAVANGFGGGLRSGEVCGAVSGGVMAIGLCAQKKGLTQIAPVVKNYVSEFRNEFGNVRCEQLKIDRVTCDKLIAYAAQLAERYINEL